MQIGSRKKVANEEETKQKYLNSLITLILDYLLFIFFFKEKKFSKKKQKKEEENWKIF